MSDVNQGTGVPSDEVLEQLLRHASPRPMPSQADEAAVRHALRDEWREITGRRRRRRRVAGFAVAATLIVGILSLANLLRAPLLDAVQVASIERSVGAIYVLGESSELRETRDLSDVFAGQTIVTGNEGGIALAWGRGGSLRMDANTRITFTNEESVYLKYGRVYFDSHPSELIAGIISAEAQEFIVTTDYGRVTHVGTQFMTNIDGRVLSVSVREGEVAVDNQYHSRVALSGQQVTLSGRQQPTVLRVTAHAKDWQWVGRTSPPADVDGRSIYEFLQWVQRETGLEPRFTGEAEQIARVELLKGTIDAAPLEALPRWMATTALRYDIDEGKGVIYVSDDG